MTEERKTMNYSTITVIKEKIYANAFFKFYLEKRREISFLKGSVPSVSYKINFSMLL